MTRRKSKNKKQTHKPSVIGRIFKWVFVLGVWAAIILGGILAWYAAELPGITKSASFNREFSITVKAADGTVIGRYGDMKGRNVAKEDLPKNLIHAVLAIEDRRFYYHPGVDFIGIGRAIVTNAAKGRFAQGGSTLTQQLAKNLFLSQERTLKRKIQEAMLALWLEHELTKDEILSAYLNRVYLGGGAYGIEAAARLYFNKDVKDLNLEECAVIAGLLKAPSRFAPTNNQRLSRDRAATVLKAMVESGYITQAEADAVTKRPPLPVRKPIGGDSARYYADWIVDDLQDLIGAPTEDIIVETTLNTSIQKTATDALVGVIGKNGKDKRISQGAVISMRPDGAVVAMVGGYDYAASQFNRATQARRQPGSSFKPFVYLAALQAGWSPQDIIYDGPVTEGRYRPKNFGNEYYGDVTLETALMLSLNTATFRLIKSIGPQPVVDVARRLGISSPMAAELSLGLGTATLAPIEMATAYATLANGGMAIRGYGINSIKSTKGELYYQRPPAKPDMYVASPAAIDALAGMMRSVIEYGTGQRAKLGVPAYGKTGTSQESRDAWFVGFTPEMATAVWLGNDDDSSMKSVTGGSFPADIWRTTMTAAQGKYAPVRFVNSNTEGTFEDMLNRLTVNDGTANATQQSKPSYTPPARIPRTGSYND
jgi:penicillin-binding protein 1A